MLGRERAPARLATTFVLTALVPLALALAFQRALFPETSAGDDLAHLAASWRLDARDLRDFALEMALLFQLWPSLLLRGRFARAERVVAAALVLYLASVWGFGLPAVPRLYLPALGFLVALGVPRLHAALGPRGALRALVVSGLVNVAIAAAGLAFAS